MKQRSALIVDDFYQDAQVVRDLALSLNFRPKAGATYPGGEAYSNARDWEIIRRQIMSELGMGTQETLIPGKDFKQGKFRLALQADAINRPDSVHQDVQRYSAIVYLAQNHHCQGGIGLYQCKLSTETAMSRNWFTALSKRFDLSIEDPRFPKLVSDYLADWSNWRQIGELPMRFNRLIVLMARCFHASTGLFGQNANNGRLTQHFEIYL
jgi:hypothetical protein